MLEAESSHSVFEVTNAVKDFLPAVGISLKSVDTGKMLSCRNSDRCYRPAYEVNADTVEKYLLMVLPNPDVAGEFLIQNGYESR